MKLIQASRIAAILLSSMFCAVVPLKISAQDPAPLDPPSVSAWSWLKEGKISFNARYRFEGFKRDGAPFTGTAYAPTLRLALGYATSPIHGFSVYAQGEAVIVTGPADFNDATLPSQFRPHLPMIADPKSLELSQGYAQWTHGGPR